DGPGRRDSTPVLDLAEVRASQSEQGGAVELGVAPDEVVRVRVQWLPLAVAPRLARGVLAFEVHRPGAPVVLFPRHVLATLEEKDALAGGGQGVEQRAAARARSDDDHVEMPGHGLAPVAGASAANRQRKMQRCDVSWWSFAQKTAARPRRRTNSSAASNMPSGGAVK